MGNGVGKRGKKKGFYLIDSPLPPEVVLQLQHQLVITGQFPVDPQFYLGEKQQREVR